jgi:phosphoglycerate kinase
MKKARELGVKVHLPVDHIIGDSFSEKAKYGVTSDELGIPDGWMALDAGPITRGINKEVIMRAKTILWNGPLGVFELGPFAGGTLSAMCHMADASKQNGCISVIGGGDTGAASQKFFYGEKPISELMSHVSTGGGSSLVLMEGKMLPAVPALSDKVRA